MSTPSLNTIDAWNCLVLIPSSSTTNDLKRNDPQRCIEKCMNPNVGFFVLGQLKISYSFLLSMLNDGNPFYIFLYTSATWRRRLTSFGNNELNPEVILRIHDKTHDFIGCVKNYRNMTSCHTHEWHVHGSCMTWFWYVHHGPAISF